MAEQKNFKIGEVLVNEGVLSEENLVEALEIQKTDKRLLGQILVEKGFVSEEQLAVTLANTYSLRYVELSQVVIDDSLHGVVSSDILKRYKILPIKLEDGNLTVATSNPLDVNALQEIQYISNYKISPVIARLSDIEYHLDKYYEAMQTGHAAKKSTMLGTDEAPVVKYVDALIAHAIKERASDIHLEPSKEDTRVRFRIDGELYVKASIPKNIERKVVSRIKILSGMDVADSRRPQDGRLTPAAHPTCDVRVSTLPNVMGENMVLRILDKSFTSYDFSSLGMDEEEIAILEKVIKQPYGIVLVTGPTGAGKTTTLYSILNSINDISKNIITVEDPVEYKMPGINQTAINTLAGYTFAKAIRHILRHDPDVILIGEIRDQETAEIAIRAALTGHLVFSTIHTNSAAGAVMRLIDMGIEPFLIQSSLVAIIAQRLVRKVCPKCQKEITPPLEVQEMLKKHVTVKDPITLAQACQCEECHLTGYTGRMAIYESLIVNDKIREMILKSPNEADLNKLAMAHGMKSLKQAGIHKALNKQTSLEEVLRVTFTEED